MRKKIISVSVVALTISLFAIAAQPKTVTSSAAVSLGEISELNGKSGFTIPTFHPFPTINADTLTERIRKASPQRTSQPTQTTKPISTSTPINNPSAAATSKPTQTAVPLTSNSYTDQVVDLVNQERSSRGLTSLTKNSALSNAAQGYSQYMADKNFFSHTGPDGSTFITRDKSAGYTSYKYLGENIAAGQQSPKEVMTGWMNSEGHRKNILKPEYREIGVGYVKKSGTMYGTYWTQEFGAR
jgi:uncharacterized protein YkwD